MSANAGCRALEVDDAVQGAQIALRLLYPTRAAETFEPFGPFSLSLALNAPIEGKDLPLVVISHGTGSTPWLHRDLGAYLARAGFVAALVQHPGNHRGDDSLSGTAINLINRPRHVCLAIDAIFADPVVGPHLRADAVGIVGHSLGGYTALAVAGGKPSCMPWEAADGKPAPLEVEHDGRVRALVLLAPATPWFMQPGALAGVRVPILMRTGAADVHANPIHSEIVAQGVADARLLDHAVIPNAGHFAFVSAYPDAMKNPAIPPSQDPEGFDRRAYLPVLFAEIEAFLGRSL